MTMKKIISIIITLVLIFGSCVNAFADAYYDMLVKQDETQDKLFEGLPPEKKELYRWTDALNGMGIAPQKHTLDDGTISEVFPNPYFLGSSSGSLNSDKLSINWSKDSYLFEMTTWINRFSFSISGVEGMNISRIALRIAGDPADLVRSESDVGGATQDAIHMHSDDDFIVLIDEHGVRDVNFWFDCRPGTDPTRITCLTVEYTDDYIQYLIDQRDDIARKIADVEKEIKSNNNQKAALDEKNRKLEEEIAQYKTEIAEWNAKIAAETGSQGTANNTGSVFSGGNSAIVIGIACLAVGFLLAMIIFRKKQTN